MTRITLSFLICSALVMGCGRSQTARRTEQNYQVVQEGEASGVTSTINAPGETAPPLTDTAVDTTTNFTLPDNPAPLGTQPPTMAGTLPPATTVPRVSTQPPPMSSNSGPITTATVPPPQPRRRPIPPPTDTSSTEARPPVTDTVAPSPKTDTTRTDTAPPPTDTTQTDTQPKTDTTSTEKPPV